MIIKNFSNSMLQLQMLEAQSYKIDNIYKILSHNFRAYRSHISISYTSDIYVLEKLEFKAESKM